MGSESDKACNGRENRHRERKARGRGKEDGGRERGRETDNSRDKKPLSEGFCCTQRKKELPLNTINLDICTAGHFQPRAGGYCKGPPEP